MTTNTVKQLAASLAGLSASDKAALARLLKPAKARGAAVWDGDLTKLDQRTHAELWLAGEPSRKALPKSRRAGAYRRVVVTFADGHVMQTGGYLSNDRDAIEHAVRYARTDRQVTMCGDAGYEWAPDGFHLTRACAIPAVVSAEIEPVVVSDDAPMALAA